MDQVVICFDSDYCDILEEGFLEEYEEMMWDKFRRHLEQNYNGLILVMPIGPTEDRIEDFRELDDLDEEQLECTMNRLNNCNWEKLDDEERSWAFDLEYELDDKYEELHSSAVSKFNRMKIKN